MCHTWNIEAGSHILKPEAIIMGSCILKEGFAHVWRMAITMYIIGITGGSGSGKGYTGSKFKNVQYIDCDKIYHNLLETDEALNAELIKKFPAACNNGVLDRKILAGIVFACKQQLNALNEITHQYVIKEVVAQIGESKRELCVIDAILLIQSGIAKKCDIVIGVIANLETRIERIIKRDGITREAALLRINNQEDDEFYINNCDIIIYNE